MPTSSKMRINKYLSENGYCSRREADRLIKVGKVFVNGSQAHLGDKVDSKDDIKIIGREKKKKPQKIYILLNKPVGIIVTTDKNKKDNVFDLIDLQERVFPIGRLDVTSEGLLIMTNDGAFANRLTHPRYEHEKEYVVEVDRPLDMKDIKQLQNGIMLDDGMTLPAKVRKMNETKFAIILRESRNKQIQRMCEALGYQVKSLKRTRILTLKMASTYPVGNWRYLTETEVRQLKKAAGSDV